MLHVRRLWKRCTGRAERSPCFHIQVRYKYRSTYRGNKKAFLCVSASFRGLRIASMIVLSVCTCSCFPVPALATFSTLWRPLPIHWHHSFESSGITTVPLGELIIPLMYTHTYLVYIRRLYCISDNNLKFWDSASVAGSIASATVSCLRRLTVFRTAHCVAAYYMGNLRM